MPGCSDGEPVPVPVKGTVKFADGTVAQGEVAMVRFEPVATTATAGSPQASVAAGNIQPDGSFLLTTLQKDDGAYEGDYKVVLVLRKSYLKGGDVVHSKYSKDSTTPLTAKVTRSGPNEFDFVVDKPSR